MNFCYKFKTLSSENSCDSNAQLKLLAHKKDVTGKVQAEPTEGNEENTVRFFPDLVDEKIKASFEPLHAQISAHTEMMDHLIQSNSAREITTAGFCETRHQYESSYSRVPGFSRFPTVAPLTAAGYLPDNVLSAKHA